MIDISGKAQGAEEEAAAAGNAETAEPQGAEEDAAAAGNAETAEPPEPGIAEDGVAPDTGDIGVPCRPIQFEQ